MRAPEIFRTFTPVGWILMILAGLACLALILGGLGFRFDPFDLTRKRAAAAEATVEVVTQDRDARAIEVDAAEDTADRVEVVQREIRTAETILQHLTIHAEAAHDAETPLDPDRRERLLDADRRLCDIRPATCTRSGAPTRDAGDGG